jgi:methionyl-tRNA synthetase
MTRLGIANSTELSEKTGSEQGVAQPTAKGTRPMVWPLPLAGTVDLGAFESIDLRIGLVKEASRVPQKERLLKILVDLGEGRYRQIVAGIAAAVQPETMVGLRVVVVANLKPRLFGKLLSEGIILAVDVAGETKPILVDPDSKPGSRVK